MVSTTPLKSVAKNSKKTKILDFFTKDVQKLDPSSCKKSDDSKNSPSFSGGDKGGKSTDKNCETGFIDLAELCEESDSKEDAQEHSQTTSQVFSEIMQEIDQNENLEPNFVQETLKAPAVANQIKLV